MKTLFLKSTEVERKWYLIDATGKRLGHVAAKAVQLLRGKDKPYFAPHIEMGSFVVITNAGKIELSGNKKNQKIYYRHSGYPGGLKIDFFSKLIKTKPELPLQKAIKGMLPKTILGNKLYKNVKIYAGPNHPHEAQKPEKIEL